MTEQELKQQIHAWEGLKEYQIGQEDLMDYLEGGIEGTINILRRMKPNQFYTIATRDGFRKGIDLRDTNYFQRIITRLNEEGLNLGKGNAEYGFKMPLPEKGESSRNLIIFRKWKK